MIFFILPSIYCTLIEMDKGGGRGRERARERGRESERERAGGPTASVDLFLAQRIWENQMLERVGWQEKASFWSKIIDNFSPTKGRKVWAGELKSRKGWRRKGLRKE